MNVTQFVSQQVFLVGALIGFIYGLIKVWKGKKPMYMKIVVMAVLCAMLSGFYNVAIILTEGTLRTGFCVSNLGIAGTFLGFLSANYGHIDGLVDDHSKELKKYRLLPLIGSVIVVVPLIPIWMYEIPIGAKVSYTIDLLILGMAVYYHVKHLIIPDVDFGIVKCIRKYNLLAIVYAVLSIGEIQAFAHGLDVLYMICGILMGVVIALIMITLERGVSKWTV